jgi:peroxiredoxin Q/BCP
VILGVSFDTVEDNRAFAEKFSFPYLLLCDTSRSIGMAYGAADKADDEYAKRVSYLIGPDGTIEESWAKVDVKAHPDEVLAKIA